MAVGIAVNEGETHSLQEVSDIGRKQADLSMECLANMLWRQTLIIGTETVRASDG